MSGKNFVGKAHYGFKDFETKNVKILFEPFGPNEDGKLITKEFAQKLVKRKWGALGADQNAAITFGKRPLMLLLSQKDCEGIRFYFSKYTNESGREVETIVLIGINSNRDDLNANHQNIKKYKSIILDDEAPEGEIETLILEVGGGNPLNTFK